MVEPTSTQKNQVNWSTLTRRNLGIFTSNGLRAANFMRGETNKGLFSSVSHSSTCSSSLMGPQGPRVLNRDHVSQETWREEANLAASKVRFNLRKFSTLIEKSLPSNPEEKQKVQAEQKKIRNDLTEYGNEILVVLAYAQHTPENLTLIRSLIELYIQSQFYELLNAVKDRDELSFLSLPLLKLHERLHVLGQTKEFPIMMNRLSELAAENIRSDVKYVSEFESKDDKTDPELSDRISDINDRNCQFLDDIFHSACYGGEAFRALVAHDWNPSGSGTGNLLPLIYQLRDVSLQNDFLGDNPSVQDGWLRECVDLHVKPNEYEELEYTEYKKEVRKITQEKKDLYYRAKILMNRTYISSNKKGGRTFKQVEGIETQDREKLFGSGSSDISIILSSGQIAKFIDHKASRNDITFALYLRKQAKVLEAEKALIQKSATRFGKLLESDPTFKAIHRIASMAALNNPLQYIAHPDPDSPHPKEVKEALESLLPDLKEYNKITTDNEKLAFLMKLTVTKQQELQTIQNALIENLKFTESQITFLQEYLNNPNYVQPNPSYLSKSEISSRLNLWRDAGKQYRAFLMEKGWDESAFRDSISSETRDRFWRSLTKYQNDLSRIKNVDELIRQCDEASLGCFSSDARAKLDLIFSGKGPGSKTDKELSILGKIKKTLTFKPPLPWNGDRKEGGDQTGFTLTDEQWDRLQKIESMQIASVNEFMQLSERLNQISGKLNTRLFSTLDTGMHRETSKWNVIKRLFKPRVAPKSFKRFLRESFTFDPHLRYLLNVLQNPMELLKYSDLPNKDAMMMYIAKEGANGSDDIDEKSIRKFLDTFGYKDVKAAEFYAQLKSLFEEMPYLQRSCLVQLLWQVTSSEEFKAFREEGGKDQGKNKEAIIRELKKYMLRVGLTKEVWGELVEKGIVENIAKQAVEQPDRIENKSLRTICSRIDVGKKEDNPQKDEDENGDELESKCTIGFPKLKSLLGQSEPAVKEASAEVLREMMLNFQHDDFVYISDGKVRKAGGGVAFGKSGVQGEGKRYSGTDEIMFDRQGDYLRLRAYFGKGLKGKGTFTFNPLGPGVFAATTEVSLAGGGRTFDGVQVYFDPATFDGGYAEMCDRVSNFIYDSENGKLDTNFLLKHAKQMGVYDQGQKDGSLSVGESFEAGLEALFLFPKAEISAGIGVSVTTEANVKRRSRPGFDKEEDYLYINKTTFGLTVSGGVGISTASPPARFLHRIQKLFPKSLLKKSDKGTDKVKEDEKFEQFKKTGDKVETPTETDEKKKKTERKNLLSAKFGLSKSWTFELMDTIYTIVYRMSDPHKEGKIKSACMLHAVFHQPTGNLEPGDKTQEQVDALRFKRYKDDLIRAVKFMPSTVQKIKDGFYDTHLQDFIREVDRRDTGRGMFLMVETLMKYEELVKVDRLQARLNRLKEFGCRTEAEREEAKRLYKSINAMVDNADNYYISAMYLTTLHESNGNMMAGGDVGVMLNGTGIKGHLSTNKENWSELQYAMVRMNFTEKAYPNRVVTPPPLKQPFMFRNKLNLNQNVLLPNDLLDLQDDKDNVSDDKDEANVDKYLPEKTEITAMQRLAQLPLELKERVTDIIS